MDSSGAREDVTTPDGTHRGVWRSRQPISVAVPYDLITFVQWARPIESIDPPRFGKSIMALEPRSLCIAAA